MTDEATILVIDRHPGTIRKLRAPLSKAGYLVLSASTRAAALDSVRRECPDLILLEANSQDSDGLEILRRIRGHLGGRELPILFLSTEAKANWRAEALKLGASDFIPLPLRTAEVIARLRLHMELSRLRAANSSQSETLEPDRSRRRLARIPQDVRANAASGTAGVHEMFWMSGADRLCSFVDAGWLKLTGRTLEQELGSGWSLGLHPNDLAPYMATYTAAFDARKDFEMEFRLRCYDGEYRWVLVKGAPRFGSDGTFEGYIGSATEIGKSEKNRKRELSARKLETLGVLATGVARDVSNLLGCILADADGALMELPRNTMASDAVGRIETVAIRASEIVQQMMTEAGEGGKSPLKCAWSPAVAETAAAGSVLVVEDEDALRRSVAEMLRKGGFSVLEASDGEAALELIRTQAEDIAVVLLDLTLPGTSSREVFNELRSIRPRAKVILTSAYGRESAAASLVSQSHEDFIRKPYHLKELAAVVRSAFPPERAIAAKAR